NLTKTKKDEGINRKNLAKTKVGHKSTLRCICVSLCSTQKVPGDWAGNQTCERVLVSRGTIYPSKRCGRNMSYASVASLSQDNGHCQTQCQPSK
ncbi:hypothetical protein HAX54_020446, partial [Datura stramonium]|nr:hypothetical protein [Datura stramonium]